MLIALVRAGPGKPFFGLQQENVIEVELVKVILHGRGLSGHRAPVPPFAQHGFQARFDGGLIWIVKERIGECFDRDFKLA